MYQLTVNENQTFTVELPTGQPLLQEAPFPWSLTKLSDRHYHILLRHRSYQAEVLSLEPSEKVVTLKINQSIYRVVIKDRFDVLLDQMGMSTARQSRINDIKAPMPGLILSLSVQPGDQVHKGDSVLILEAMKMENVIKAPGDGVIKAVRVNKGDSVEKNQILVEFTQ